MKKLLFAWLLLLTVTARSQYKGSIYVFDANWKPTSVDSARFLLYTQKLNDSCWEWDYYHFLGTMLGSEQYSDKDGKVLNGICRHYNEKGLLDSGTRYTQGKKNGDSWKLSGDSLRHRIVYTYQDDSLIKTVDRDTLKKDSSLFYKDEKESEFPGGIKAWYHYLSKNLVFPQRAISNNIQGQVVIQFVIDKVGNVIDPVVSGSVEFSIDQEALRIITGSGKWQPAFQNGHNVKSYKSQPLNFKYQ